MKCSINMWTYLHILNVTFIYLLVTFCSAIFKGVGNNGKQVAREKKISKNLREA